jgi:hypothetical protein
MHNVEVILVNTILSLKVLIYFRFFSVLGAKYKIQFWLKKSTNLR